MIICRKCSRRYADGSEFCTCGAFLEFDGERVDDAAPTGGPATTGSPTDVTSPMAGEPAPGTPPTGAPPPDSGPSTEPAPWSGLPSSDASQPATGSVDARHPDAPVDAGTTEPVRVDSTGRPSDITCHQCGTANPPQRQFCRHCGQPVIAVAPVAADGSTQRRTSWWQRIRQRGKPRRPTPPTAGARRVSGGGLSGRALAVRGVGVAILLGGLLAFLGPWRGPIISKGRELAGGSRFQVVDDVEAEAAPASASVTPLEFVLQPPELVVDDFENTAWATRWVETDSLGVESVPAEDACVDGVGTDSVMRFTFAEPADLERIRILGGRFAGDEARTTLSRPRIVELRTDEACTYLELDDDGELATHDFDRDDVTQVELRVLSRYADETTSPTVEISAVVFDESR